MESVCSLKSPPLLRQDYEMDEAPFNLHGLIDFPEEAIFKNNLRANRQQIRETTHSFFITRHSLIRHTWEEWNGLKSTRPCPLILYVVMKIFGHHDVYRWSLKMVTYQRHCDTHLAPFSLHQSKCWRHDVVWNLNDMIAIHCLLSEFASQEADCYCGQNNWP